MNRPQRLSLQPRICTLVQPLCLHQTLIYCRYKLVCESVNNTTSSPAPRGNLGSSGFCPCRPLSSRHRCFFVRAHRAGPVPGFGAEAPQCGGALRREAARYTSAGSGPVCSGCQGWDRSQLTKGQHTPDGIK